MEKSLKEISWIALRHKGNIHDCFTTKIEGSIIPADMELEILVFCAVTDGGAMEMLMVLHQSPALIPKHRLSDGGPQSTLHAA